MNSPQPKISPSARFRIAFIVSHPIQYYAPLYRELSKRVGFDVKVFYTWRDDRPAHDSKFQRNFAWDIPLMEGYDFEVVPNESHDPGTHHRAGLKNSSLVGRVKAWNPDAVQITGYNYISHGRAIRELSALGIPVIFRGDSHLLDGRGRWWKWLIKKKILTRIYRRPAAFACVGRANRNYYRAFGVPESKLFHVPHTIDVERFSGDDVESEARAGQWRQNLGISKDYMVFLYAAKFEARKRPLELLRAFGQAKLSKTALLFVGSGELEEKLKAEASKLRDSSSRIDFLSFQNQSVMPDVYRLGDVLVLPSGYGETWGLSVNEAQACGRPALVSDCVGCSQDIVRPGENGGIFRTDDWGGCGDALRRMAEIDWRSRRSKIREEAKAFDTSKGVDALIACLRSARGQTAGGN